MAEDPLERATLVIRARDALARLDFNGAVKVLFKLELDRETRVLLARAYRNTGRPREARKLVEPLVDTSADAATELGLLELALRNFDAAHALFTHALQLHDSQLDSQLHVDAIHALAYIAEARTRGGEREEVYALLRQGFEVAPDHHVLLQTLGIAHLNDGRIEKATQIFAEVIAIRADVPWAGTLFEVEAHGNMACALVAAGRIEEALDAVERAMQVCPRWLRQGMSMAMQADPDLAAIHEHPSFLASMAYRDDDTREARIARIEAALAAKRKGPPPLPSLDGIEADARSGDDARVDEACRQLLRFVSARDEIWEDHGFCERRTRDHAEALIEQCLRDPTWLQESVFANPTLARVELVAFLVVSHDEKLRAIGEPLALAVLTHCAAEKADSLEPLLNALTWEKWYEEGPRASLPDSAPFLVEVARANGSRDDVRRAALEALCYQGDAQHAVDIADLVDDEVVASMAVQAVHTLEPSALDPEPLLHRAATRFVVARTYAAELFDCCFDELMVLLGELDDARRMELLRALMPVADARLVPAVLEACEIDPHRCLAWLRLQPLSDAQLDALMAKSLTAKRIALWLAAVARGQGRLVSVADIACLRSSEASPNEGTASLVGYANVRNRADWLRDHVAMADKRALHGIVVGLSRVGDSRDLPLLERLGERVQFLKTPTLLARALLGDDLDLVDGAIPKTPFAAWALERLVDRHGPQSQLLAVVDRATERGLHNQDLVEFRRVIDRLRKARPTGAC